MPYNIDSGRLLQTPMFYLFRLFYSFLPLHNPIGFGAADFIELALAILLVAAALAWHKWAGAANRLAVRTLWCMVILGALPVVLRLAMLHTSPDSNPSGRRRFQLSVARRHAGAFPPDESNASDASLFRDSLRSARTEL